MNPADGPFAPVLNGMLDVGRYGKGTELASMYAYLTTPEAAFITGATINIDGGFNI
ncbi:SDR family oxidoreductase [Clostridium pasteurianum]|uniref:SDR family oxidoreductase n=1 Tax=Clostridium pasteurianum TaxID=1501 RepID=UPI00039A98DE|nr:SDR family oxidoreductase [Clostridium pasteurianum]